MEPRTIPAEIDSGNPPHADALAAFSLTGRAYTYANLYSDTRKIISQFGESKPARVALCCNDTALFASALLACISENIDVVLLPNHQTGTLALHQDKFDAIITDLSTLDAECADYAHRCFVIQETGQSTHAIPLSLFSNDISVTFYTSGSSGKPKAVSKRLKQLILEIEVQDRMFGEMLDNAVVVATVSHQHIYGLLFKLIWALWKNRPFCRDNVEFPEQLDRVVQPFVLVTTPTFLRHVPTNQTVMTGKPGGIFSSGGRLNGKDAQRAAQAFNAPIIEILGSTETGGIAYRKHFPDKISAHWRTLPGVTVRRVSDTNWMLESPFSSGPQDLEDDLELLADGTFLHHGRRDRVVKIGEKRLSLAEMETLANASSLVSASAIFSLLKSSQERIALVAELSPEGRRMLETSGKAALNQAICSHLSSQFDRVTLPRYFRYPDELPQNAQGKRVLADLQRLFDTVDD
ncbi:MAG: AMP-binding protein [Gammaproteobacteria bacterium]|nr:AMP-binding protein [Gammaproteobacteria bacterium]